MLLILLNYYTVFSYRDGGAYGNLFDLGICSLLLVFALYFKLFCIPPEIYTHAHSVCTRSPYLVY